MAQKQKGRRNREIDKQINAEIDRNKQAENLTKKTKTDKFKQTNIQTIDLINNYSHQNKTKKEQTVNG